MKLFEQIRAGAYEVREEAAFLAATAFWLLAALLGMLLATSLWKLGGVIGAAASPFVLFEPLRRRARLFALAALSLPIFLGGAEIVIRVLYFGPDALKHPARYQPYGAMSDPAYLAPGMEEGVVYTLRPGFDGWVKGVRVAVNSSGMRDAERAPRSPAGKSRVLVLGTSVSLGEGVPVHDRYSSRLEEKLAASGVSAEVANMAVGGGPLATSLGLLESRGLPLRPHMVVLEFSTNNLGENVDTVRELRRSFEKTQSAPLPSTIFERGSFALAAIYPSASLRARLRALSGRAPAAAGAPAWDYASAALDRFAGLSRANKFKGVVFNPRPMHAFANAGMDAEFRGKLRALAGERGLIYADAYEEFSSADKVESFIIFPGDLHPNAKAHERYAAALARAVEPFLRALEARR